MTPLNFTYKKAGADVWVLNTDDIPLDKAKVKDEQIVYLAPNNAGGNHKHPRTEWFVGIGELIFIWLDDVGKKHEEHMNPEGRLLLFEVSPFLPHAVANRSDDTAGILFEMADGKLETEEAVKVV